MTGAHTPAGRLALAFGDVDAMSAFYADAVEWSLPASLPFPRPVLGKEAVTALNQSIWSIYFFPDCGVEIVDEAGDEVSSAVRIRYSAISRLNDKLYQNEYNLFVRASADGITHVFEGLDTMALYEFLTEHPTGHSFLPMLRD